MPRVAQPVHLSAVGSSGVARSYKIKRGIGCAFIRLGRFQEAIENFESIMDSQPDPQTSALRARAHVQRAMLTPRKGFNLIVCYYARGDKDRMKKGLLQLLATVGSESSPEEEDVLHRLSKVRAAPQKQSSMIDYGLAMPQDAPSAVQKDELHAYEQKRCVCTPMAQGCAFGPLRSLALAGAHAICATYQWPPSWSRPLSTRCAVRLGALVTRRPTLACALPRQDFAAGFDWVIERLKAPRKSDRGDDK